MERGEEWWPGHNSKTELVRVVFLVRDISSQYDLAICEVSWIYSIQFRGYESDTMHGWTDRSKTLCPSTILQIDLFVLRFYGPVNPMGSCRARSVYLITRLLGRLSPLSGLPVLCTFFHQKLTTALLESAVGRILQIEGGVIIFSISPRNVTSKFVYWHHGRRDK